METEGLLVQLEARIDRFEKSFERASRTADQRWREIENRGKQGSVTIEAGFARTGSSIERAALAANRAMMRMGASLATALSIREIAQAADAWQSYQNKLSAAGVPTEKVADTLNRLTETAVRTRSDLGATVDLFSKLTLVSEQYGLRADQAQRVTETVAKSLKAAGASASEASSTITQLSQALASGVLQGDELRAIRESAPLLLKAIAKELGTTTGALKQMGEEGKLTSDVILKALLKASTEIDKAFSRTNLTLADGFTNLQTTFVQLVGEFDRGSGLTRQLGKALDDAGMSLEELKGKMHGFGENMAGDIEKAIKAAGRLYEVLSLLGKWSPTGLLARWLAGDLGGGKKQEQFGPDIPGDWLYKDHPESTATPNPLDTSNIKAVPKDYSGKTTDLLASIKARTRALETEIQTWGRSTFEVERAKAAQELYSKAESAGIPISASLRAKIEQSADAYARQAAKLENLKTALQALDEVKSSAKEFASGFAKDMANGVSGAEALTNALSRLQDKLIDLAASKLIDAALGGATGGLGGLLGNLIGGHAEGGLITGPGSGTSDSMVTRVSNGEFIVRAEQTSKYLDLLQAINAGQNLRVPDVGGQISVAAPTQNFAPVINIQSSGGTKDANQDLAERMERKLREMFTDMYSRETVKNMRHGGLLSR